MAIVVFLLAACAADSPRNNGEPAAQAFRLSSIAKTDLDRVAEIHLEEGLGHLRTLMEKLYKRNPGEWKKTDPAGYEKIVAKVFDAKGDGRFDQLGGKTGVDCIYLAFREDYMGDRVLAFIYGLTSMIRASYNNKSELFITDTLDAQKLYNSARNLEIAAWKLSNNRTPRGEPFLLSNDGEGPVKNLSFEREFGKLIAVQDTLARIISEKTNRNIVRVIQNLATAVFLPI